MPDRDAARLLEIETAAQYIVSFVDGLDEATFLADSRTSAAVAMYLIVIGESAKLLSEETLGEAPEIPWPQIIALRNRMRTATRRSIGPRFGPSRQCSSIRFATP